PLLDALRTEDNDLPSYYFYDSNGKLVLPLGLDSRLTLDGYLSQDDLRVDLDEGFFFDQRWSNRTASAEWQYDFSPTLTGTVKGFFSRYRSSTSAEFFSTPASFGNELRDASALATMDWRLGADHAFKTGLQFSDYDFSFLSSFNQQTSIEYAASPYDISWFVEDDWTPGDRINIQEGIRLRYFSEGQRWLFEPRLSVSVPASDTVTLQLGSGLYNQYVQLVSTEGFSGSDFYLPLDETVKPGFAWQNVLGARWDPTAEWRFSVEGYASDLRNLVLLETDSSADESDTSSDTVFRSGGTGYAAGVELFAEKRTGMLRGWVGYTLGWTRRTFDDVNGGREFPPKYDRRHDLKAVGLVSRGKWKYSTSFVLASGQAFTTATARYGVRDPSTGMFEELVLPGDRNGARLAPYHRLDVSATRSFSLFGRDAEWVFQVFNLYGRRNEWFVQYDITDGEFDVEVVRQLPMIPTAGINFTF
ncbi:MAG: TonB-dependent receptor, partial [Gemmatimonadetes bacterium]|nr:TonB-dependent receptor [Gemmatimonadota bacterium]